MATKKKVKKKNQIVQHLVTPGYEWLTMTALDYERPEMQAIIDAKIEGGYGVVITIVGKPPPPPCPPGGCNP